MPNPPPSPRPSPENIVFRTPEEVSHALNMLLKKVATMPFPPVEFTARDLAIARVIYRAGFSAEIDEDDDDRS